MITRRFSIVAGLSAAFLFATALAGTSAPDVPTVHFTTAGDFSASANAQAVFSKINEVDPDLHLALGDLSYAGPGSSEQAWCDVVTQGVGAGFPFELIAGNHESNGSDGHINNFSACLPNQLPGVVGTYGRQWYVDVPQVNPLVRFIMISPGLTFPDGAYNYSQGSTRYQWTSARIDAARTANIPWVVVGMHMPCLGAGEHSCDAGPDISNLLVSKRVDLVLTGHEHMYARTKQLRLGAGCTAISNSAYNPSCVIDADNSLVKGAGTVFETVGTGGVESIPVNTNAPAYPYFAAINGSGNPTFGILDLSATADSLTAAFVRASGGAFSDSFSITSGGPPVNEPPTAAFTSTSTGLTAAFDASGSVDSDGTISSYAWDFGDSQTGTGATTSHPYATAGTYQVKLTVTDDAGAPTSLTKPVTVSSTPAPVVLASDDFGRTVAAGWGTADLGGTWTVNGSTANASVSGGTGMLRMATAGAGPSIYMSTLSSSDTDLLTTFALDKVPVGGTSGVDQGLQVRRIAGVGDYRAKVRFLPGGAVRLGLYATNAAGTQTPVVAEATVPGLVYTAGTQLDLRVRATGTSPTQLKARIWRHVDAEPATWNAQGSDSTAALQVAGSVGFHSYLASSVTNAPLVARFDNMRVSKASTLP